MPRRYLKSSGQLLVKTRYLSPCVKLKIKGQLLRRFGNCLKGNVLSFVLSTSYKSSKYKAPSTQLEFTMTQKINKIVLAYSGGLDTSVMLSWLKENYNCEVVCYCADVGQGAEL